MFERKKYFLFVYTVAKYCVMIRIRIILVRIRPHSCRLTLAFCFSISSRSRRDSCGLSAVEQKKGNYQRRRKTYRVPVLNKQRPKQETSIAATQQNTRQNFFNVNQAASIRVRQLGCVNQGTSIRLRQLACVNQGAAIKNYSFSLFPKLCGPNRLLFSLKCSLFLKKDSDLAHLDKIE